jgi:hypothetical protein
MLASLSFKTLKLFKPFNLLLSPPRVATVSQWPNVHECHSEP